MRSVDLLRRTGAAAGLILAGAVALVGPVVPIVSADNATADCSLPFAGRMGAINYDDYVRPIGTVKAIMLFVDFSDAPAATPADHLFEDTFSGASDWLTTSSYGKVKLDITPVRHWLRIADPLASFTFPGEFVSGAIGKSYITEALKAADPEVDFSAYRIVYIIPNKEATSLSGADTRAYSPSDGIPMDGTLVRNVVTLGSNTYKYGPAILEHETGHAFGVTDYYGQASSGGTYADAGDWSIMSDGFDDNDHLAFDKWRYGWLTNDQIACINDETDDDYVLSPLATDDDGVKAVVLRTGLQSAIVAEYRTAEGNDANVCSEGVLIYRVNSTPTGSGPVKVVDSLPGTATGTSGCKLELWDAPFTDGDTFTDTASGIEISIDATGDGEADIHVTRTSTYTAPVRYGRSLTIRAVRNASGTTSISGVLTASRHFAACQAGRSVSLQRRVGSVWLTVRTANTNSLASWAYTFKAKPGVYRLLATDRLASSYDCLPAFSKSLTIS